MTMTPDQAQWFAQAVNQIVASVGKAVLGKDREVRYAVAAMLAEGHILLEDAPGTGKTQLARALAVTVAGTSKRIQFTPDLLPTDVTGVTVFDQRKGDFEFLPGPVFAHILLADEINRASPKTQSALLEVMEEGQVTVDGVTRKVGRPFMVIATQNPIEQAGTYRLPEAQLDRFLMKTSIGYPDMAHTVEILSGAALKNRSSLISPVIPADKVAEMADLATTVHVADAVLTYIATVAEQTRLSDQTRIGVSVRGALAMTRTAKVWAASQGRPYVTCDDVKDLRHQVWDHRLILDPEAEFAGVTAASVIDRVIDEVPIPQTEIAP
ncbi:MAG: MoxR family ATPase [Propionibacteriaceae bacterium]|nr:MoxR family ATPase [Propionibacteriaceae bacterium]